MNITQFIDRETAATPIGPPLTVATAAAAAVLIAAGAVALAVETPSSAAVVTAVPLAV
jgi:hypothetical protein